MKLESQWVFSNRSNRCSFWNTILKKETVQCPIPWRNSMLSSRKRLSFSMTNPKWISCPLWRNSSLNSKKYPSETWIKSSIEVRKSTFWWRRARLCQSSPWTWKILPGKWRIKCGGRTKRSWLESFSWS